jgi:hypothetical protein
VYRLVVLYAIRLVLSSLTLSQQSVCEHVFNGGSDNETIFSEIKLAPIQATILVGGCFGDDLSRYICSVYMFDTFRSARSHASSRENIALFDCCFGAVFHSSAIECATRYQAAMIRA